MSRLLDPPLVPRNGRRLKVLGIARISKERKRFSKGSSKEGKKVRTEIKDERSLEDQEALYRARVQEFTDLPFDMTCVAGQGSGECIDRKEAEEAQAEVETGAYDLVITEDLGRIFRRVHAYLFCETCQDVGTRLIALNDHVDTGHDDWRLSAFFAVMRHEAYNSDTAQRIRRSLRNRFTNGGIIQFVIFGYIKPEDAETDADLQKHPAAEPIYKEWFRRLDDGATYAEIADWLNEQSIPVGPYCRSKEWSRNMVRGITHNTILKGIRQRNNKMSVRINKTGHHHCVNAPPEELLERHCPHLAFFDEAYYDRVVAKVDARNAKNSRVKDGQDPLRGRPRKRTRWPGQHIYCGLCGRMFVYGGHGQMEHLICDGARKYRCWHSITADGPMAAHKLTDAIMAEIELVPDFEPTFREMLQMQLDEVGSAREGRLKEIARAVEKNARETENVMDAIRNAKSSPTLLAELQRLEEEKGDLERERLDLQNAPRQVPELPPITEIRQMAREKLAELAENSQDCARLIRVLIPKIVVHPYRLCDGGHLVLRARFKLNLSPLLQIDKDLVVPALERELVVDLFDPPQREAIRKELVALRAGGMTQLKAAQRLGVTHTAAQRAAALQRQMDRLGLTDPYVPVLSPPDDYKMLRRHKHRRYRFEPLDDAQQT